jgi:diguanylate cyclase (GGDEF)-like protein
MKLTLFLEERGRFFWGFLGGVVVISLGVINYFLGFELNTSFFYFVPIAAVAWFAGREPGLVIAGLSAIAWFLTDVFGGYAYSSPWYFLGNALIRVGFFLGVTGLVVNLRKALKTNQELARTDYITGAVSVRYFHELAQKELGRSDRYHHPFTFAYIDLDNFKELNERQGHATGDDVLRTVSDVVQRRIRNIDIFCRLGGDEFALLMPETGEVEAQSVISRVRRSLLEDMKKHNWDMTFSIGVVTFIRIPKTVDDMVRMADDVMHPIKIGGKNAVSYTIYEG